MNSRKQGNVLWEGVYSCFIYLAAMPSRETIANRDSSITERDSNIMGLQQKAESVKDTLKVKKNKIK